jgi:hypothetical protein
MVSSQIRAAARVALNSVRRARAGSSFLRSQLQTRRDPSQKHSTALDPVDQVDRFRVTHPFHPLHGREFELVDRRSAWAEDRVYFHDETGRLRRIPTAWTSAAAPDTFVVISAGRAHFRTSDLLQLATLIAQLMQERSTARRNRRRKQNVK